MVSQTHSIICVFLFVADLSFIMVICYLQCFWTVNTAVGNILTCVFVCKHRCFCSRHSWKRNPCSREYTFRVLADQYQTEVLQGRLHERLFFCTCQSSVISVTRIDWKDMIPVLSPYVQKRSMSPTHVGLM